MRGSSGARGGRLRALLIVGEVALSVVLLVGSSLLLISFLSLQRTPPGFDPTGVATAFVGVPAGKFATPPNRPTFFAAVVERAAAQPADHARLARAWRCRSADSARARRTAWPAARSCRCRSGRSPDSTS